ncbi:hypothetical protein Golax_012047, partial [Gossypium laxum]|nr:hypothetical protein [Gossypium laxum]
SCFIREIQGFLSYPKFSKRLWFYFSNAHKKVSSKCLLGCRVWFFKPQISKGRFGFGPNRGLLKSHWCRIEFCSPLRRMMKMERNNGDYNDDFKIILKILKSFADMTYKTK